ncbi:MAG: voltage-dependent potassium channel subunit beta [Thermoanaerobaculia bacterium]|nr:voltage-dependent potassium channel subunit beta [Thermoanaerobaculia bacterium]
MEYRFLGRSGLKVSALSFGSWVTFGDQIGDDVAYRCMTAAWDAGVNFFDNAEVYAGGQSETMMGRIFKKAGWKRSDYVVSTKVFWGGQGPNDRGLSRKHVVEGTLASLERLGLDYVDLLFCHRPDYDTPVEETVRAMSHLVDTGRAFYWGTSEWPAERILEAYHVARREHLVPPLMEQPQYHMFHRERVEKEYAPLYQEVGLGTTIWSPLASGLLTGKYDDGIPEGTRVTLPSYAWLREMFESADGQAKIAKVRQLAPIAEELGCTRAQLAIAWCLKNPNVSTVITGASSVEQVVENMKALAVLPKLGDELMARIESVLGNRPEPLPTYR